jgi:spore coat protein U-like protein
MIWQVWLPMMVCLFPALAGAASCSITSPTLNFGSYDPLLATNDDSTAVVQVSCTRTILPSEVVNYTLTSSIGNGPGYAARRMVSGVEILNYNVYRNAARTQVWGNGTGGSFVITGSFNLNNATPRNRNHTLYGRIPPLQNAAAGANSDTLVVTLTF